MEKKEPTFIEMQAIKTIGRNLLKATESDVIPGLDFVLLSVSDCGGRYNPYVHLILHGIAQGKVEPLICAMNTYKAIDCRTIFGTLWKNPLPTEQLMRFVTLCEADEYIDEHVNRKVTFKNN